MSALPEQTEGGYSATLDAYAAEKATNTELHERMRQWAAEAKEGRLPASEGTLMERWSATI